MNGFLSIILILLFTSNLISQNSIINQPQLKEQDTTSYLVIGFGSMEKYTSCRDSSIIIRRSFKQVKEYDKITYLGIHNIPVDTFMSIVPYLKDIIRFSWNDQKIKQLPDEFFTLKSIKFACFFFPEMTDFPNKLYLLSNLKSLCINKTKIRIIPESIGSLKNLRNLDLTENQISQISPSIGKLHKLQSIDLSLNNLKSLPNTFTNLRNLDVINLDNNKLEKLPESFINLKKIRHLSMRKNNLTFLPNDFGKISDKRIRIEWFGNPWNEKDLKLLKTYKPYSFINQKPQ